MTSETETKQGPPLDLWVSIRIFTVVVAILAWGYHIGGFAGRSFLEIISEPWYRYDTFFYVRIVSAGYQSGDITSGFHPLYPWLSTIAAFVLRDPLAGLMFVSSVASFLVTVILYKLARLDLDHDKAWTATALLLCWPAALAMFVPYTEALYMLLAVSCFFAARKRQFLLAGLIGGLAALTRQHGILLVLPLLWELWDASGRRLKPLVTNWRAWVPSALVPAGYAVWILYRAIAINDVKPDFSSPQRFIYSVMVSPTAYQIFSDQQFLWPWQSIWKALVMYWRGGLHFSAYGDAFLGMVFIIMFVFSWRYVRGSYRIYSLAVVLIALSLHTGVSLNPYISLPRHLLPAFPVFIGLVQAYQFKRVPFILGVLLVCQMLFLCCFVWQTWVL
jgi:Gpi18-like mannosyltransferase